MSHGGTKNNKNPPLPPFGKGGLGGFSSEEKISPLVETEVSRSGNHAPDEMPLGGFASAHHL